MRWYFIYKIQINESIYIGSTCNVNRRMNEHIRHSCDDNCCNKLYTYIKNNGGWKTEYFSIIDTLFCDEFTSRDKEREMIFFYKAGLNSREVGSSNLKSNLVNLQPNLEKVKQEIKLTLEQNKLSTDNIQMDFTEDIKHIKPTISAGSLKTYNSLLRSIYTNVFGKDKDPDIKNFTKHKEILEFLSGKAYGTRKTYLASLVCIAPHIEEYRKQMLTDIKEYSAEVNKSELTDKLENSAIGKDEIDKIAADLKSNAEALMKKKSRTISDLMEIQNYVLLSLYHGYVVPRRALDYTELRFKDYDKEKHNYIDLKKNKFVFNIYKTAKKMGETLKGQQELDIPPGLKKILIKWIGLIPNGTDHMFFNAKIEPLSNVTLNQRLNAIFGGKKSVNALRHFYLTSKYKDLMIQNQKMAETMEEMGSSSAQSKVYVKVNDKE